MAAAIKNFYVGLDMGASGIAAAVLGDGSAGMKPLGFGYSPAPGADQVGWAVQEALCQAGAAAGVSVKNVLTALCPPGLLLRSAVTGLVLKAGAAVTRQDLQQLQRHLTAVLPADYTAVQLLDLDYYLDGEPIAAPLKARGRSLKLEAKLAAVPDGSIEITLDCLVQAGFGIKQIVVGPLAAAEAVLTAAERELGVICVDLGAGSTKAAYFNHGRLGAVEVFPAGSGHITSDLAVGLHTQLPQAEALKIQQGLSGAPEGQAKRIILSRVEELLDFVGQCPGIMGLPACPPGGIVLTGGGARLKGLEEFAASFLSLPVRLGNCPQLTGMVPAEEGYRYHTAIGLGLWHCRQKPRSPGIRRQAGRKFLGRIKKWL